jgi:hypothetical protein
MSAIALRGDLERLHWQLLDAYPACLAFSAQQNAKRRLGTPPLQGIGQAAALSFGLTYREKADGGA